MTCAVPAATALQHARNEGLRLGAKTTPLALAAGLLLAAGLAPQAAWAQASETRVQAFSYHPTTALLTQQVNEPDNAAIALTTDYTYDGFGNQLSATVSGPDIVSRATSATYTPDGRFLETATNALTHSETHATDARFGTVTSLTGPNLLATTWVYDGFGRKTTETRADGTETRWTYELCAAQCPAGGVYRVTAQDFDSGGTASSAKAIQYLDTLNRVFRSETEGFDGTPVYVDTEFTARGEVHRVSKPYFQGTPAQDILWTTYAYDVLGRVTSVTLPDGGVESTAYDGLTTTLTNALTQTSVRVENALGALVSATDNLSNVTTYAYDPFGNLTETDAAGVVTTMTYDVRGLKLTMDDPDMGDWSYDYNALGELVSQTDAKGQVTTMAYDVLGRMTARTDAFGTVDAVTTTWTYDTATKGIGKIHTVSAPHDSYAEAMTYDSLGRPSTASVTIDGTAYDTTTLYDTAGRADTLVYPTGFTVRSSFTPRGHLSQVTDDLGSTVYWQADTVNAEGQVTAETLGNGVTTTRVYDPATSRIDSILTTKAAVTIQDLGFDFDTLGNLTERRDLRQDRAEAFTYDGLNRLKSTTLTDTATLQTLGTPVTYTYDALGNITNKSDVGAYTYGTGAPGQPGPHAVVTAGGNTYTYDANGSMETGAGKTTTWTPFNKPKLIVASPNDETFFVYGPSRARFKQNIKKGGLITNVIYVGSHFEKKTRVGEDDELVHYIRAGATVAIYTEYRDALDTVTSSKTRYLHRDHLGSVESITDEAGAATEYLSYDPHGKRRLTDWQAGTPVAAAETPRGFTGHEHLDAVGLIHMNGRVYDPTLGRFLSADPFVQAPETTQGFNRYAYVSNNPLSYTDPSGFSYKDIRDGVVKDFPTGNGIKDFPTGNGTGRSNRSSEGQKETAIPSRPFTRPQTGILGALADIDDFLSGLLGVDPGLRDWHRDLNRRGTAVSWSTVMKVGGHLTGGRYIGNNTIEIQGSNQVAGLGEYSAQVAETLELKVVYVVNGLFAHGANVISEGEFENGGGAVGVAVSWPHITFPNGYAEMPEWVGEFDFGFTFSGFGIAEDYSIPGIGTNPLGKWSNIARGFGKFSVDMVMGHGVPSVRDLSGRSIELDAHALGGGITAGFDYDTNAWETTGISIGPGATISASVAETRVGSARDLIDTVQRAVSSMWR
ncbi:RHS repeat-associated core domain-containing protein [Pelagibius sp.]|uniref:RHS repeat-associated core domain-containing protein n=1 Tax=Pelagibius sp. TaxID=1931238 RepID=UPI003B512E6F